MSRKLDRKIAENVFSYKVLYDPVVWPADPYRIVMPDGLDLLAGYSTDIKAAWQIVEEAEKHEVCLTLIKNRTDGQWVAKLTSGRETLGMGMGKTAAMAISRSAQDLYEAA